MVEPAESHGLDPLRLGITKLSSIGLEPTVANSHLESVCVKALELTIEPKSWSKQFRRFFGLFRYFLWRNAHKHVILIATDHQ